MKKINSSVVLLIAGTIMLSYQSQAQSISITRRHYTAGYYIDMVGKKKAVSKTEQAMKQSITSIENNSINSIPVTNEETPEQMTLVAVKNISIRNNRMNKHIAIKINKITQMPVRSSGIETSYIGNEDNSMSPDLVLNASKGSRESHDAGVSLLLIVIITIFIPPLGVALVRGINIEFWLDLILTLLFFIPGLIYGLIVVLS